MHAGARHLRQHARFYVATLLGVAVWLIAAPLEGSLRLLITGDAVFAAYLITVGIVLSRSTPATFRARVGRGDEGAVLIGVITVVVVGLCLGSIFALLNHRDPDSTFRFALSLASVPLGWFMLHTGARALLCERLDERDQRLVRVADPQA